MNVLYAKDNRLESEQQEQTSVRMKNTFPSFCFLPTHKETPIIHPQMMTNVWEKIYSDEWQLLHADFHNNASHFTKKEWEKKVWKLLAGLLLASFMWQPISYFFTHNFSLSFPQRVCFLYGAWGFLTIWSSFKSEMRGMLERLWRKRPWEEPHRCICTDTGYSRRKLKAEYIWRESKRVLAPFTM